MRRYLLPALLPLLLLTAACASRPGVPANPPLVVSAASDLTPAFRELGEAFTAETGVAVTFNFGSSGKLAQQIQEGAPVDVFASANRRYIQELVQGGYVLPDTITLYALGSLTLWMPTESELGLTSIRDLARPEVKRIAIANPAHAPYGVAARQALQAAGVWEAVQDKLVYGDNIAQTLQFAESGNVDAAIMALSLSLSSDGRWFPVSQEFYDPLAQTAAVVTDSGQQAVARRFLAFLGSEQARSILMKFGFTLPDEDQTP